MRALILGFALPSKRFEEVAVNDRGMPIQTQRFGTSLLRAFQSAGVSPIMVTAAPARDYPHNSKVFFRSSVTTEEKVEYHEIGFLNLPGFKHVTRFLNAMRAGKHAFAAEPVDAIVVHGIHSAFLAAAITLRRKAKLPIIVILTDPPSVLNYFDSALVRILKRLDAKLIRFLLGHFNGVIALTAQLAETFAPRVPFVVMEGIVPQREGSSGKTETRLTRPSVPVALYAGGVSESYGIELLQDAQKILASEVQIVVYGKGPMVDTLVQSPPGGFSVEYGGMLGPAELFDRYLQASVLVNPRPIDQSFVPYSFPSKIMEYVASGTPVVTTKLPGIPDEYWQFIYPAEDSAEGLARAIRGVLNDPLAVERSKAARKWITENKSPKQQGIKMRDFIHSLKQFNAIPNRSDG